MKTGIDEFLQNEEIAYGANVKLNELTHTKTGGVVPYVIYPKSLLELRRLLQKLKESRISFVVLGEMTNVAIASGDLNFSIVCMTKMVKEPTWSPQKHELTVSAGVKMKSLSRWARDHGVSDLQWMEGIPGTVGAGVFMNAGFLSGQDVQSFLISVDVLSMDGEVRTLSNQQLHFGYRRSSLQKSNEIVVSAKFLLRAGKRWKIAAKMLKYHHLRQKNQPLEFPSAGTVFVPPTPYHLGAILPQIGMLNAHVGGARVSEKSPGFIIGENMTGEDYHNLVLKIQAEVLKKKGISIVPEVRMIGFSDQEQLSWPNSVAWSPNNPNKSAFNE